MFSGPTLVLFRLSGIPVGAHWSLLIALVLMAVMHGQTTTGAWGWAAGLLLAALAFGSVLLHELGHSVVARRRGVPILGIDLHLFGGVAKMAAPPRSPKDEVAIAIAGPLVSLALGIGLGLWAFFGLRAQIWTPGFVGWIASVNLGIGVFNLLPALPMDGGRVARAFLAKRHGLVEGTRRAIRLSRILAVAVGILGAFTNPWLIAIAALIWWMGREELAQVRAHDALHKMGYRDDAIDPWARYHRAADRNRGVRTPPKPTPPPAVEDHPSWALADMLGEPRPKVTSPDPEVQRFVRDADGNWVVVTSGHVRW